MKYSLLLVVPLLLVAGCTSQTYGTEGAQDQQASAGPSIKIVSPQDGAVITGTSTIGIRVNVTGIRLIDVPADGQNRDGYGHVSYFLDGQTEHKSPYITDSFANVAKGVHTIRAELRNNDDSPLVIPIYDEVTVTVV
jgi:hypothetical protein